MTDNSTVEQMCRDLLDTAMDRMPICICAQDLTSDELAPMASLLHQMLIDARNAGHAGAGIAVRETNED